MARSATNTPVKKATRKRAAKPAQKSKKPATPAKEDATVTNTSAKSGDTSAKANDGASKDGAGRNPAGHDSLVVDRPVRPATTQAPVGSGSAPGSTLNRSTPVPPSAEDLVRATSWSESLMTEVALKLRHPEPPRSLRRNQIGGVAPYVAPKNRVSRWMRMRELSRGGYVPLTPGRRKLRHRILPRSVIGISTMLLMLGVGSAFSGAAFYAYYDNRLAENEQAVARFVEGFDQQYSDATGAIDELRVESITEIRDELKPLGDYVADADGVVNLPLTVGPSVWSLESRDEDGEIVIGSAFAVIQYGDTGTALVTSYSLVEAATTEPSPGIDLIKGNERIPAQLWAWDAERDLALVVVEREIPPLEFAGEQGQLESVGSRLFALSGVGGNGATASPGVLLDHSQIGLQHTAPIGTLFRGGPLLNGEGKVLGVASDHYRPFGIDPGDVRQAPDVRGICVVLLECSEIREEFTIEVTVEETEAPLTTDELVRETPTGDEVDEADESNDADGSDDLLVENSDDN